MWQLIREDRRKVFCLLQTYRSEQGSKELGTIAVQSGDVREQLRVQLLVRLLHVGQLLLCLQRISE